VQKKVSSSQINNDESDVQKRYEMLVKSGAKAISSEMLFGEETKQSQKKEQGRWSTPVSLQAIGDKIQDHIIARTSIGSSSGQSMEEYKQQAKQRASEIAAKTYEKASQAKHAALDWFSSMASGQQKQ
jgi:hypothetical protein